MGHNSYYYTGQKYSINGHDYAGGEHEAGCWCGNGGRSDDDDDEEAEQSTTEQLVLDKE